MILKYTSSLLLLGSFAFANISSSSLANEAEKRTKLDITYNPTYFKLAYPNGDVPAHLGVCTDVVIRTYREFGVDLQKLVHEDMKKNFSLYPSKRLWGLNKTDRNIDHRRVANLRVFFKRHAKSLPVSSNPKNYKAGDLITWVLPNGRLHIGIVSSKLSRDKKRPLIVHNIQYGTSLDDMLFEFKITGHFRYKVVN